MKMKSIFLISALSLLAVSAIGVGVGLQANNKAEEVRADVLSNKMFLQLNNATWNDDNAEIVLRFSDGSNHTWSDRFAPNGTSKYNEFTYSLAYTPTKVKAYKIDPAVQVLGDWIENEKDSNSAVWAYTNEQNYHDVMWLGSYYNNSRCTEAGTYPLDVTMKGGTSDHWTEDVINTKLSSVKLSNDKSKIEAYGLVTIPANTYFKTYKSADSGWYGTYSAESRISARFSNTTGEGSEGNILDTVGGTYEIYFKFDEDNTLWITDPISAAADEWAQDFLGSGANACNATTKANWGTLADDYEDLARSYGSAFTTIFTSEAHVDHEDEVVGYIKLAVQRYDYVLQRYNINAANDDEHGYEDFMLRAGKIPSGEIRTISNETATTNNTTMIIVLASVITLAAVGGYFLLRKRKED